MSGFDEQEIRGGDSIVAKVSGGLKDSDYLVVVLSKASVASRSVQEELNAGFDEPHLRQRGRLVLPVLIEKCDIPPLLQSRLVRELSR